MLEQEKIRLLQHLFFGGSLSNVGVKKKLLHIMYDGFL